MIFEPKEILAFANRECPEIKLTELPTVPDRHTTGIATNAKHQVFLLCAHERWPLIFGLRSVLKIKRRGAAATSLLNGQTGKNTAGVGFWGEGGPVMIPSKERATAHLHAESEKYREAFGETGVREHFARIYAAWMQGGGSRAHETEIVTVANLGYTNEEPPVILTIP